jgi:MFS family permease
LFLVRWVSRHFFYGWIVVACSFLAQMITCISNQGLSTYVEPLRVEFGWNAAQTAAGRSFQQVDSFLGPLNGWLVDRFGPRMLMSIGVLLFALSYAVLSRIDTLLGFYVACLCMALANSLIGLLVVSVAANNWFRQRRSTANGLAASGYAIGGIILIPALVWMEESFGWRWGALGSAAAVLVLGLPIMLLMRDSPERFGLKPDNAAEGRPAAGAHRGGGLVHFTLSQALRTPAFWLVTIGTTLVGGVQSAVLVHQFPQLEAIVDRNTAALVLAELNVFSLAGRILGGVIGDRYPKNIVVGFDVLVSTAGLAVLSVAGGRDLLFVYGALFGLGWGMRIAAFNSMLGDYFGRTSFGKIAGTVLSLASPFAIAAPPLVGVAVDWFGGYHIPVVILTLMSLASAVLFFVARRPADPAQAKVG